MEQITLPPPDLYAANECWLIDDFRVDQVHQRVMVIMDWQTRRIVGWSIVDPCPDETQVYLTYMKALREHLQRTGQPAGGPKTLIMDAAPWFDCLRTLDMKTPDTRYGPASISRVERWVNDLCLTLYREYPAFGRTLRGVHDWLADYIDSYNRGRDA